MTKAFLKNAWYAAAWSDEVTEDLFERTIIGQSLLFYRDAQGQAVVLNNRCPHRSAPLQMGKRRGDVIECPYHGLRFDKSGSCVHNPHGDGRIPEKMMTPAYPVEEKHLMLWVWMGDPDLADPTRIPDFSCHTDERFKMVKGVIKMDGYYELITDNLMDLTHVEYLHDGILGSDAISRGEQNVEQVGTTIWSNRWCPDGMAPPAWDKLFKDYGKPVDHWLYMRWDAPAHMLLDVGVTPCGKPRGEGVWMYGTDILTPQDEHSTYYFWAASRAHDLDDPCYDDIWAGAIELAFGQQDKPMIEAQQKMLQLHGGHDMDDVEAVYLPTDVGPMRARRCLKNLIEAEASGQNVPEPGHRALDQLLQDDSYQDRVEPVV